MSTETEIKVKLGNVEAFRRQVGALNPVPLSARHFEDNQLLDFPDQRLRHSQCLLRIRFAEGKHYVTHKGPPRPDGLFKTREELETLVDDGEILLQVLEQIGMCVSFRYQKYREEFSVRNVHIAIDETPIGNYVEFEGPGDGIQDLAGELGIAETQYLRSSYYSLYLEHCRENGEAPKFMVF